MPSGGTACAHRRPRRGFSPPRRTAPRRAAYSLRHRDHREHHLEIAVHRGAQQRADLHAKNLRPRKRQADAAQAEERIAFLDGEARHRLVAAGIDGADRHRLARRPFEHLAVGAILGLLVGQPLAGTGTPCASGRRRRSSRCRCGRRRRIGDVDQHATGTPSAVAAGFMIAVLGVAGDARHTALRGFAERPRCRLGRAAARCRHVRRRAAQGRRCPSRRCAEADHHRHAARARQHRDMAGRTALRQRDAAAGRPVGRQEVRRRQCPRRTGSRPAARLRSPAGESAREHLSRMSLRSAARARK